MPSIADLAAAGAPWNALRRHLEGLGVVGDQVAALYAVEDLPEDADWPTNDDSAVSTAQRHVVAAWFSAGREVPATLLSDRTTPAAVRQAAAETLIFNLLSVSSLTGYPPDEVVECVLWETGMERSRLEALMAAVTRVDVQTLLSIADVLGITHDGDHWRMEDPDRVARRIERSRLARSLAERARHVSDDAVVRALESLGRAPSDVTKAASDPRAFQEAMNLGHPRRSTTRTRTRDAYDRDAYKEPEEKHLYRPLYDDLITNDAAEIRYSLADIVHIQARSKRKTPTGGLTYSAMTDPNFWTNGSADNRGHVRAWQAAGLRVSEKHLVTDADGQPDLERSYILFRALPGRHLWLRHRHDLRSWHPPTEPVDPWDAVAPREPLTFQTRLSAEWFTRRFAPGTG